MTKYYHNKSNRVTMRERFMLAGLGVLAIMMILTIFHFHKRLKDTEELISQLSTEVRDANKEPSLTAGISYEITQIANEIFEEDRPLFVETMETDTVQSALQTATAMNYTKTKVENEVVEEVEPVTSTKTDKMDTKLMVSTNTLNIRKEPNSDAEVMMKVNLGTKLKVVGLTTVYIDDVEQEGKWYKVKTSKGTGYCSADYLTDQDVKILLGYYKITYYCECSICCGIYSGMHKTASGAVPTEGVTVAADASIPFGTQLEVDGHVYTVQDRGGMINANHLDIFKSSHSKALASGCQYNVPVYQVVKF